MDTFPTIKISETLLILTAFMCLLISLSAFHPDNTNFLKLKSRIFYLDFLGQYLFFITAFFGLFFYVKWLIAIGYAICVIVNLVCKVIYLKILLKLPEDVKKTEDKKKFNEVLKIHKVRNITQLITIILVAMLFILSSKNVIPSKPLLLSIITLIILPILWGIAEVIDHKINHKKITINNDIAEQ